MMLPYRQLAENTSLWRLFWEGDSSP